MNAAHISLGDGDEHVEDSSRLGCINSAYAPWPAMHCEDTVVKTAWNLVTFNERISRSVGSAMDDDEDSVANE